MFTNVLIISSLIAFNAALVYVSNPMPYLVARQYCQAVYNSDLASIITPQDRNEAISMITTPNQNTWIGLYSTNPMGNWKFLNGELCPFASTLACVDFWLYHKPNNPNGQPRCIKQDEDGYECAYFDSSANGVDNNINCLESKPFLCDNQPPHQRQYEIIKDFGATSYTNGQQACQTQFGTNLATIITEQDRTNAITKLQQENVVTAWIGLNDLSIEGMTMSKELFIQKLICFFAVLYLR